MTDSSSPDSRTAQTTNALVTQLTTGPSMREVAAKTLRPALKALYPQLDIDPDLAIVVSPSWRVVEGQVTPGAPRYEHLSSVLALQANADTPVVYIDGEHYLTYRNTNSGPDIHLPVRIDDIARMINEFAPLLFIALQEQQLDYWNHPRPHRATLEDLCQHIARCLGLAGQRLGRTRTGHRQAGVPIPRLRTATTQ